MLTTATLQTSNAAAKQWHCGHHLVDEAIRRTRRWICEASQNGTPSYRDLASQLRDFSAPLRAHFQQGNELYESLRQELWCVEVESAKRQAAADQHHLLVRLEAFVMRLEEVEPPFASFEHAQNQLEWFFDELDQLEERESDSFGWLLKNDCS
jgi:hypothetical protein